MTGTIPLMNGGSAGVVVNTCKLGMRSMTTKETNPYLNCGMSYIFVASAAVVAWQLVFVCLLQQLIFTAVAPAPLVVPAPAVATPLVAAPCPPPAAPSRCPAPTCSRLSPPTSPSSQRRRMPPRADSMRPDQGVNNAASWLLFDLSRSNIINDKMAGRPTHCLIATCTCSSHASRAGPILWPLAVLL